jgi:hypothetical protein
MSRGASIAIALAVLLAIGSAGVGTAALMRKPTPDRAPKEVAVLRNELAAAEGKLEQLLSCIPEIGGEITGLTPESNGAGAFYLQQHSQVSSYCTPVLEGHAANGP